MMRKKISSQTSMTGNSDVKNSNISKDVLIGIFPPHSKQIRLALITENFLPQKKALIIFYTALKTPVIYTQL